MSFSVRLFSGCLVYTVWCAPVYATGQGASIDIEAQCRLEAEGYGIPPEQMEEYLDGCVLASGGSLSSAPEQSAGIEAQCRQEAKDYGVAPEQQADYINGCILSLGGSLPADLEVGKSQEGRDPATTEVAPQELQKPVGVH